MRDVLPRAAPIPSLGTGVQEAMVSDKVWLQPVVLKFRQKTLGKTNITRRQMTLNDSVVSDQIRKLELLRLAKKNATPCPDRGTARTRQ